MTYCANCGREIVSGRGIAHASLPEHRVWLHVGSGRIECLLGDFAIRVATPRRAAGDSAEKETR